MSPSVSNCPYLLNTVLARVPGKHAPAESSRGPQPPPARCGTHQGAAHLGRQRCVGSAGDPGEQETGGASRGFPSADASRQTKTFAVIYYLCRPEKQQEGSPQKSGRRFFSRTNAPFVPSAARVAPFIAIQSYIFLQRLTDVGLFTRTT